MITNYCPAEDIIAALTANNVEPRATHTDARGDDWGFVNAYLADEQENYAIQYGNNGTTDYEMTTDIDDLASWLITDDADAAAVANARDEDPEVVADDHTGPCHIMSKSDMYGYSVYAYELDRESNQQDRLEFDSRAEAQEWIDETESEIYRLAHNEAGRPDYFIVAE